ncbi:DUF559 domain-containing protein [Arcanobacterium bovis]|uniref:DUF559 domain-containing protein n=1 Tax=Arcanobacterium bovis TaxID=2529275 RepID=A0A4Q9V029_9ACTO|nr:DUF559 domain-containing protein [Arcanobacterium bovis]
MFLWGISLIVECDSAAHHSQYDRYRNDRRRDLAALALGYHVIRLSYEQIWDTWDETQKVLSNTLKARIHHQLTRVPVASRR